MRGDRGATRYDDSVGVGMYRIDLHPSTAATRTSTSRRRRSRSRSARCCRSA
nr:FAD-dependent oxidoreductase [Cellulosimicrobium sp. MM]